MKPLRVYVDTSVFGGCFDPEFAARSSTFFELVGSGRITVLVSELVLDELATAPARVRAVLAGFPHERLERVDVSAEVVALRAAFLDAKIVTAKSSYDATHVAAAVVAAAGRHRFVELQAHRPDGQGPPIQRGRSPARLPADRDRLSAGGRIR